MDKDEYNSIDGMLRHIYRAGLTVSILYNRKDDNVGIRLSERGKCDCITSDYYADSFEEAVDIMYLENLGKISEYAKNLEKYYKKQGGN